MSTGSGQIRILNVYVHIPQGGGRWYNDCGGELMPKSRYEASKDAIRRYLASQDDIRIRMAADGRKDTIKAAADAAGQSVNAYILQAVEERMQRAQANK